jgi:hypothetical protein
VAEREDSRTRHPFFYGLVSGAFFFMASWKYVEYPLVFSIASGVVMAIVVWTGWRRDGWLSRMNSRNKG